MFDIIFLDCTWGGYLIASISAEIPDCINTSVTVTEISQTQALPRGISGQEGCWKKEDEKANILMN